MTAASASPTSTASAGVSLATHVVAANGIKHHHSNGVAGSATAGKANGAFTTTTAAHSADAKGKGSGGSPKALISKELSPEKRQLAELVQTTREALLCCVCLDTSPTPISLGLCGHLVCQPCLIQMDTFAHQFRHNHSEFEQRPCPSCRAEIVGQGVMLKGLQPIAAFLSTLNKTASATGNKTANATAAAAATDTAANATAATTYEELGKAEKRTAALQTTRLVESWWTRKLVNEISQQVSEELAAGIFIALPKTIGSEFMYAFMQLFMEHNKPVAIEMLFTDELFLLKFQKGATSQFTPNEKTQWVMVKSKHEFVLKLPTKAATNPAATCILPRFPMSAALSPMASKQPSPASSKEKDAKLTAANKSDSAAKSAAEDSLAAIEKELAGLSPTDLPSHIATLKKLMQEAVTCGKCNKIAKEPMLPGLCGHVVCKPCLKEVDESAEKMQHDTTKIGLTILSRHCPVPKCTQPLCGGGFRSFAHWKLAQHFVREESAPSALLKKGYFQELSPEEMDLGYLQLGCLAQVQLARLAAAEVWEKATADERNAGFLIKCDGTSGVFFELFVATITLLAEGHSARIIPEMACIYVNKPSATSSPTKSSPKIKVFIVDLEGNVKSSIEDRPEKLQSVNTSPPITASTAATK